MSALIVVLEKLLEKLGDAGEVAKHPYIVFALPMSFLLGLFMSPEASIKEFFCFLVDILIFPFPETPDGLKLAYLLDQLAIASGGFIESSTLYYLLSYVSQLAILGMSIKIWKLVKW